MLVRFTPRQINKLKEMLKTVRLNAYDIPLYTEIISALDKSIDEKKPLIRNTSYRDNNIVDKYTRKYIEPQEVQKVEESQEVQEVQEVEEVQDFTFETSPICEDTNEVLIPVIDNRTSTVIERKAKMKTTRTTQDYV